MSSPNTDHASGEVDAGHTQIRTPLPDQINNGSILFHEASMSNPMPQIASPMESGGSIVGPGGQLAIQGSRSSSLTGGPTVGGTPTATHSRRPSSSSSQLSRTGTFGGLGDGDALDSVIPSSPPGSPRPAPRQPSVSQLVDRGLHHSLRARDPQPQQQPDPQRKWNPSSSTLLATRALTDGIAKIPQRLATRALYRRGQDLSSNLVEQDNRQGVGILNLGNRKELTQNSSLRSFTTHHGSRLPPRPPGKSMSDLGRRANIPKSTTAPEVQTSGVPAAVAATTSSAVTTTSSPTVVAPTLLSLASAAQPGATTITTMYSHVRTVLMTIFGQHPGHFHLTKKHLSSVVAITLMLEAGAQQRHLVATALHIVMRKLQESTNRRLTAVVSATTSIREQVEAIALVVAGHTLLLQGLGGAQAGDAAVQAAAITTAVNAANTVVGTTMGQGFQGLTLAIELAATASATAHTATDVKVEEAGTAATAAGTAATAAGTAARAAETAARAATTAVELVSSGLTSMRAVVDGQGVIQLQAITDAVAAEAAAAVASAAIRESIGAQALTLSNATATSAARVTAASAAHASSLHAAFSAQVREQGLIAAAEALLGADILRQIASLKLVMSDTCNTTLSTAEKVEALGATFLLIQEQSNQHAIGQAAATASAAESCRDTILMNLETFRAAVALSETHRVATADLHAAATALAAQGICASVNSLGDAMALQTHTQSQATITAIQSLTDGIHLGFQSLEGTAQSNGITAATALVIEAVRLGFESQRASTAQSLERSATAAEVLNASIILRLEAADVQLAEQRVAITAANAAAVTAGEASAAAAASLACLPRLVDAIEAQATVIAAQGRFMEGLQTEMRAMFAARGNPDGAFNAASLQQRATCHRLSLSESRSAASAGSDEVKSHLVSIKPSSLLQIPPTISSAAQTRSMSSLSSESEASGYDSHSRFQSFGGVPDLTSDQQMSNPKLLLLPHHQIYSPTGSNNITTPVPNFDLITLDFDSKEEAFVPGESLPPAGLVQHGPHIVSDDGGELQQFPIFGPSSAEDPGAHVSACGDNSLGSKNNSVQLDSFAPNTSGVHQHASIQTGDEHRPNAYPPPIDVSFPGSSELQAQKDAVLSKVKLEQLLSLTGQRRRDRSGLIAINEAFALAEKQRLADYEVAKNTPLVMPAEWVALHSASLGVAAASAARGSEGLAPQPGGKRNNSEQALGALESAMGADGAVAPDPRKASVHDGFGSGDKGGARGSGAELTGPASTTAGTRASALSTTLPGSATASVQVQPPINVNAERDAKAREGRIAKAAAERI